MHLLLRREAGLLLGLLLLVVFSWLWLRESDQEITEIQTMHTQDEVDGYLGHFVMTGMNAQGKPNHRLEAERMVLYTGTRLSQVEKPFLTLYRANENPWLIRAENGLVQTDVDIVFLTGNVRMTQEDGLGNVTEILTEKLEVQTKLHYASTEHSVVVNHAHGQAMATGMQAYLDKGQMSLLEQVRSHYEAPRH